jgi:para-aminobenzoate synthetase component 1
MRLSAALHAVAEQPEVWCLAGPWSLLTWDVEPVPLADVPLGSGSGLPDGTGWTRFDGGFLIQADYAGRPHAVRVRSGLRFSPDGTVESFGGAQLPPARPAQTTPRLAGPLVPAWSGTAHAAQVERLRGHIAAGDCYQVNLTVPFHGTLAAGDDLSVAATLLERDPPAFGAVIRRPGQPTLISHSPECFLAVTGATILSCPIKGTRRSGRRAELLTAEKDRAELAMIVDLVRNDLGRVAERGSVRVTEPGRIMDLSYVHHLVADVIAQLRPGVGWGEIFAAAFPAGSITGAPKAMAMDLIARHESGPRGAYCGTFGWAGRGAAQLAVAIRTLTVSDTQVAVHAGSGIVADSDGAAEWDEVRAKAAVMAAVLGSTV